MERQLGDLQFPAVSGVTPLTRLVEAATGNTLPYSFEVQVNQQDLRLLLGAFFLGRSPWSAPAGYVDDITGMAQELLEQVPPGIRPSALGADLPPIGRPQERS